MFAMKPFSYGIDDPSNALRLPNNFQYIEDRRPASDSNPYIVCAIIMNTTIPSFNTYPLSMTYVTQKKSYDNITTPNITIAT
jgi:glutamine synthetase